MCGSVPRGAALRALARGLLPSPHLPFASMVREQQRRRRQTRRKQRRMRQGRGRRKGSGMVKGAKGTAHSFRVLGLGFRLQEFLGLG